MKLPNKNTQTRVDTQMIGTKKNAFQFKPKTGSQHKKISILSNNVRRA